jgi:L-aspartate oxidase
VLVEEGPARVRQLIEWGVAFDTQDGELLLAQEAAHSRPRILHARGDGTGLEVETALIRRLRASGARVIEHADVTGVLTTTDGAACVSGGPRKWRRESPVAEQHEPRVRNRRRRRSRVLRRR